MKKILILALSIVFCITLAACGGTGSQDTSDSGTGTKAPGESQNTTAPSTTDAPDITDTPGTAAEYTVKLDNGKEITVGGSAAGYSKELEGVLDFMEAPSCVHEGFDKVYTFDGYTVTTSPDANGDEYVSELSIISDIAALESGLSVGSDAAALDDEFGDGYEEQFGVRKYTLDGITVSVILDGGIVTGITFSVAT